MHPMTVRATGLLLGHVADRLFGDPRRFHPVAGFGRTAALLERHWYADTRARGVAYVLVLVGGATLGAVTAERCARHPVVRTLLTAAVTWTVLGGRSLEREALTVHRILGTGDIDGARRRLRHLVGRDTTSLTEPEIARAVIESVAENTSDAVVTPYFWGAVAGVPGLVAHRAANTLDAMVGHHNPRYERFGWAAARFDDLLGLPGARMSAALTLATGPHRRGALTAWMRDAHRHPSPNAGVIEACFAGALGLQLGGTNTYYGDRREQRALMGDGRHPVAADIPRTGRLARNIAHGAVITAASVCLARGRRAVA
jgi:adenosylcobinamide-phosphate synthase